MKRSLRLLSLALVVSVLALAPAARASSANLLVNSGFDSDLSGWDPGSTPKTDLQWQSTDATGHAGSGSLQVTNHVTNGSSGMGQCVAVTGGATYEMGARVEVAPGQAALSSVAVIPNWFSQPNCPSSSGLGNSGLYLQGDTANVFRGISGNRTAPANAQSVLVQVAVLGVPAGGAATASFDDVYFQPAGGCTPEATVLCLGGGRFRVEGTYSTASSGNGQIQAVALTDDTGYFWFFSPSNVEMVVKVLNACALNDRFWVYSGGLTDQGVNFTVTDTAKSVAKSYGNSLGTKWVTITDSSALASCP